MTVAVVARTTPGAGERGHMDLPPTRRPERFPSPASNSAGELANRAQAQTRFLSP